MTPSSVDPPELSVLKLLLACPDAHIDSDGLLLGVYLEQLEGFAPTAIAEASRRLRARWESTKPPMPGVLRRAVLAVLAEWREAEERRVVEEASARTAITADEARQIIAYAEEQLATPGLSDLVRVAHVMSAVAAKRRLSLLAGERTLAAEAGGRDVKAFDHHFGGERSRGGLRRLCEPRGEEAGRGDVDRDAQGEAGDRGDVP